MSATEDLAIQAKELTETVDRLNKDSVQHFKDMERMSKLNTRLVFGTIIGLFLDVTLTILLAFQGHQVSINEHQITQVTDRLNFSQTVTRKQVLCPLYKTFLASKSTEGAANFPQGAAAYMKLFAQLQNSYDVLDCNAN